MYTLLDFWIFEVPMTSIALKSSDIRLYLRDSSEKKCSQNNHILTSPPCQAWKPRGHDVGTMVNIRSILALQIAAPHSEVRSHRKPVAVHATQALCQLPPWASYSLRTLLLSVPCTLSSNKESRGNKESKDEGVIRYSSWEKGLCLSPSHILSMKRAQHLANSSDTRIDRVMACPANICFIFLYPGFYVRQFPQH